VAWVWWGLSTQTSMPACRAAPWITGAIWPQHIQRGAILCVVLCRGGEGVQAESVRQVVRFWRGCEHTTQKCHDASSPVHQE
jgi:hypothetical protein